MTSRSANKLQVLCLILLPIVLISAVLSWHNARMLSGIADKVNQQEAKRAEQALKAGFDAALGNMQTIVSDNAWWDDGYKNITLSNDLDWINETWSTGDGDPNYDTHYIIRSDGSLISGLNNNKPVNLSARDYYGSSFDQMMVRLPKDNSTFFVIASLAKTPDGLAVVAAAPVTPVDLPSHASGTPRDILLMSKILRDQDLAKLAQTQAIEGLSFQSKSLPLAASLVLESLGGEVVSTVYWINGDPGKEARNGLASSAAVLLLGVLAMMFPVALLHYRIVGKLHASEQAAFISARTDALSGLANRRSFLEHLEASIQKSDRTQIGLALIDLDGFKAVNDAHGHEAGDRLIVKFATELLKTCGKQVHVARLGGDEFAIVLMEHNVRFKLELLASDVLELAKLPFELDGCSVKIGASIGLALSAPDVDNLSAFLHQADVAMYKAKQSGRGKFCWFGADDPGLLSTRANRGFGAKHLTHQEIFEVPCTVQ